MNARTGLLSFAGFAMLLLPAAAKPHGAPAACELLTPAEAGAAMGTKSYAGKQMMPGDATGCIWSDDPQALDSSRKVAVNQHTPRAFQMLKSSTSTMQKLTPVSGVGDEAYYVEYPSSKSAPPFIWFKKGDAVVSIRILIGTLPDPFSTSQHEAKLLVLAKAAAGRV